MNTTTVQCPRCRNLLAVPLAAARGQILCPRCHTPFTGSPLSPGAAPTASFAAPVAPAPAAQATAVFPASPATPPAATAPAQPTPSALAPEVEAARADPRRRFGHFVVLNELGKGGMGVVYRAWHERLRRIVALKTILPEVADEAAIRRFEREGQAVARLRHPNIVAVHEVGEIAGKHYLAMDFIEGVSLDRRLGAKKGTKEFPRLPLTKAIGVVRDVALAVQHAHEQGVIHRDLKPANIMLDASDRPFVMDFGLARLDDGRTKITKTGSGMGTPAYMPPEQAGDDGQPVSERSDVYSLGATLYHVLTGRPPFEGATEYNVLAALLSKDPDPPRSINPRLAPDLETIALRCLEKSPEKRYASAKALAEDLDRYLAGEPIVARSIGELERLVRRAKRNKSAAVLAGVATLAVLGGGAFGIAKRLEAANERAAREEAERTKARELADKNEELLKQNDELLRAKERATKAEHDATRHAEDERKMSVLATQKKQEAEEARARAEEQLARFYYERALEWIGEGRHREAALAAANALATRDTPTYRSALALAQRGCWQRPRRLDGAHPSLQKLALSADGRVLAGAGGMTQGERREIWFWDMETGQRGATARGNVLDVQGLALRADGAAAASVSADDMLRIWDPRTGDETASASTQYHGCSVVWSPDGERLAVGMQDGRLRLFDARPLRELAVADAHHAVNEPGSVFGVDWCGDRLATASTDGTVGIWDAGTLKPIARLRCDTPLRSVSWRSDAKALAAGGLDRRVHVFTSEPGGAWHEAWNLPGHDEPVTSVAFLDDVRLASASDDHTVRLWDSRRGLPLARFSAEASQVQALATSRRRGLVAAAHGSGRTYAWDLGRKADPRARVDHQGQTTSIAFSPDSRQLAAGGTRNDVTVWNLENGEAKELRVPSSLVRQLSFLPDGSAVVSLEDDLRNGLAIPLTFWSARDGTLVRRLDLSHWDQRVVATYHMRTMALSPDGTLILLAGVRNGPHGWGAYTAFGSLETGAPVRVVNAGAMSAAWAPDGSVVAFGAAGRVHLIDTTRWTDAGACELDREDLALAVAFSADAGTLAASTQRGDVRLWDSRTRVLARELHAHAGTATSVAFGPQSRPALLATGGSDRLVKLWNRESGEVLAELGGHRGHVSAVAISPDGRWLASAADGEQATLLVWDIEWILGEKLSLEERKRRLEGVERETGLTFPEKTFEPVAFEPPAEKGR